jgi:hypothetical protein
MRNTNEPSNNEPSTRKKRVKRDALRQKGARDFITAGRHSQEDRGVAQWINDGQQCPDDQQDRDSELNEVGPDRRAALFRRSFQMAAEPVAHGREQLVLKTDTGRVEQRRDRFRPMASCVSALPSIVANGHQVLPSFSPLPLFIPYGGFSPVRLEASLVLLRPSETRPGFV